MCIENICSADLAFIEVVLKAYRTECFSAVRGWLKSYTPNEKDAGKAIRLLKFYLETVNEDSIPDTSLLPWDAKYLDQLKELDLKTLCPEREGKPVFSITNASGITKNMQNIFNSKVPQDVANKETNFSNLTLKEVVEKKVHLIPAYTGRKNLYCFGKDSDGLCIILFGETPFGKMLKDIFDCSDYSEHKIYQTMRSGLLDELADSSSPTELNEAQKAAVEDYARKIAENRRDEQEVLLNRLIERCDIPYTDNNKNVSWIRALGYGKHKFEDIKCPVCGALLLAERDLLKIGHIAHQKEENNRVHLPMLMCANCYKSLSYAEDVYLPPDIKLESLDLSDTNSKPISVVFDMYANESKKLDVDLTFLSRWIWHCIITGKTAYREQQSNNAGL